MTLTKKDELLLKLQDMKMKQKVEKVKFQSKEGKEEFRHHIVTDLFKEFSGREMTELEYKEYIKKFDNPELFPDYNIITFLKEKGFAVKHKDWKSDEQIGKELEKTLKEKLLK